MKAIEKIFPKLSKRECGEFGLVSILAALVLALYFKNEHYVMLAFVLTLITLVIPVLLYPLAVVWFGLSKVLGMISSAMMMGLVFYLVVVPVGLFRKLRGIDSMKLRQFKKGRQSVMVSRDHWYTEKDFLNTF